MRVSEVQPGTGRDVRIVAITRFRLAVGLLLLSFAMLAHAQTTLKSAFGSTFLVGVAINQAQFSGDDARGTRLIDQQFNCISPENILKWQHVHPKPEVYDFSGSDQFVAFGEKKHMVIIGHTLIWHKQTPTWVFEDEKSNPVPREALLNRMREHIRTVVGRYKGRIRGWDVVNEALNEDGTMRQSPWMKIIGPDYVLKAFQYAHEADPHAELYYNDYSLENEAKRKGALELIKRLQGAGVRVTAVGLQSHDRLDWPTLQQLDDTISAFTALGVRVNITELDVTVLPPAKETEQIRTEQAHDPYTHGLPTSVQQALAKRYAGLFSVFLKHHASIDRVTFWGVTDADSWLNNWPVRGRTDYPLLFDRDGKAKLAFSAVIREGESATTTNDSRSHIGEEK
jgi:endo-1,4-beta-xylanase